jgi:hypothetical protein
VHTAPATHTYRLFTILNFTLFHPFNYNTTTGTSLS